MSEITPPLDRIEDLRIERELQDSYLTYAMSTIMDRALPDVRDGLKPSQRRILVAMNDLGLGPRSKHRKCAKIAGDRAAGRSQPRHGRLPAELRRDARRTQGLPEQISQPTRARLDRNRRRH